MDSLVLEHLRGHPNILQLVEGEQSLKIPVTGPNNLSWQISMAYFSTELAAGNLRHYIYSLPNPLDSLLLFREACKGVQRIHAQRVVHRDIKPDNCLLFPGRILKLSDFGTAKNCSEPPLLRG
ncbi:MAG TPA: protein kinase [Candidatus Binatia bacterium]